LTLSFDKVREILTVSLNETRNLKVTKGRVYAESFLLLNSYDENKPDLAEGLNKIYKISRTEDVNVKEYISFENILWVSENVLSIAQNVIFIMTS